jgi:SAM-dependent methyltransferase
VLPWEAGISPTLLELLDDGSFTDGRDPAELSVIDVGCGDGRDSIFLAREAGFGEVVGIDVSASSIRLAEQNAAIRTSTDGRISPSPDRPRFLVADFFDAASNLPLGTFDVVWDRGLFHNLDAKQRARYVAAASALLKPDGALFVLAGAARSEAPWPCPLNQFPSVRRAELSRLGQEGALVTESVSRILFPLHLDEALEAMLIEAGSGAGVRRLKREGGCEGWLLHARRRAGRGRREQL